MGDKRYEKAVSELMTAVTALTGLPVIWKDADGQATESLSPNQQRHRNPFCDRIKNAVDRLRQCSRNDTSEIAVIAETERRPFIHRCHAGVDEMVTPIFVDGVYAGAFFLGPFRRPDAECVYSCCCDEFNELPEYNADIVSAAGRILRLLEFTAGHHARTLAVRESFESEANAKLRPALEYMAHHFKENITASEMAELCHLSTSRFIHLFNEKMNAGFSDYLRNLRIEEAKILLSNTDMRIGDIASRCGFQSQSYFGLIFRRVAGMKPTVYRESFWHHREP